MSRLIPPGVTDAGEAEATIDDFLKSLGPVGPALARIGKTR